MRVAYAVMLRAESIFLTDLLAAAGALTPAFTPGTGFTLLDQVHLVYREARFSLDDRGLTARNSPPPVLKRYLLTDAT